MVPALYIYVANKINIWAYMLKPQLNGLLHKLSWTLVTLKSHLQTIWQCLHGLVSDVLCVVAEV